MRTLEEVVLLVLETLRTWLRYFPVLATWFLLGWTAQTAGQYASAWLGARHQVPATLVFVLGAVLYLVALIMMIHSLKPALRTPRAVKAARVDPRSLDVPLEVFRRRRGLDVALLTIAPFLGVYAVWGLVEKWVRDLFIVNVAANPQGRYDPDTWSVDLRSVHLPFYVLLTVVAFALRQLFGFLAGRGSRRLWSIPLLVLEGLWAFATFMVLLMGLDQIKLWFMTRRLFRDGLRARDWLVDQVPDIHLPFGWSLPEAVVAVTEWVWGTLLPAAWQGVMLPLVWLALTATVFGWREFSAAELARGTRLSATLDQFADREGGSAWVRLTSWATADLRAKYVPILQSFRLVSRAGLRFVAAYLIVATSMSLLSWGVETGLTMLVGAGDQRHFVRWVPLRSLVADLLMVTLTTALYVCAFDRAIADVTGVGWRAGRHRRATHVEAPDDMPEAPPWAPPAGEPVRA